MIYPNDTRVRYSPELSVWVVDTQQAHAGGAQDLLAAMMAYATEAGQMPDGCTCAPESFSTAPLSFAVSPPRAHKVYVRGGLVIAGHGTVPFRGRAADVGNAYQCPLSDAAGEERAYELGKAGAWDALHALTAPFPGVAGTLQPADPGSEVPAVWEGHLHADTRADLARVAVLSDEVARLDREARRAQATATAGPEAARELAAEAAMTGKALEPGEVTRLLTQRQESAVAARAMADGTRDALEQVRRETVERITERRDEWLSYLHGQAAHGLARLDLVLTELESAVENLAEIDRVRQTVERPVPRGLFAAGSPIAGNAVEAARQARERAAGALAGLERHAARVGTEKASQRA
ncbi:hypothetical protein [Micromonospora aurantiaca (nom. illeg.)]|uniref:hypothetical protein n=1 Tax=Micromonospora aurantiaca (nom. illeg.) TaxID=47850 RepID=UPI0035B114C8